MDFIELANGDLVSDFKKYMQKAFQNAFENIYGKTDDIILPYKDIECSLSNKNSKSHAAIDDGKIAAGAIVTIDTEVQKSSLDFLLVRDEYQNRGVGKLCWDEIEMKHPDIRVWETHVAYFDKRNIRFYVNKLHFKIVEFYSENHNGSQGSERDDRSECDEMFR